MNRFTETIATDHRALLKRFAYLYSLSETGFKQVRVAFTDFLVDHENYGATHFKTTEFTALFKRELLIRNPVHALAVSRQLARIRYDGIAINDANATDIRRAHFDYENFGTIVQADLARQTFVDAEKTFHAFDAPNIHRPQRTWAVA